VRLVRRWLTTFVGAFGRPTDSASGPASPSSDVVARSQAEEPPSATAATTTDPVDEPHDDNTPSAIAVTGPDQEEIDRRRDLVRGWFNDFWTERDEKPASFADRLNEAENYINDRLLASGESWQLDADARAMLSLPVRTASRNANGHARAARERTRSTH
jgi:hypothetical protein